VPIRGSTGAKSGDHTHVQIGRPDQGVPLHQRVGLPPGRLGHLRPADPPAVDTLDWMADAGVRLVPAGHGPGDGAERPRQPPTGTKIRST